MYINMSFELDPTVEANAKNLIIVASSLDKGFSGKFKTPTDQYLGVEFMPDKVEAWRYGCRN